MPLILHSIPNNHFNKLIISKHFLDFYIINDHSRRILSNLFDGTGNIASYNDFNAFMKKFDGFGESEIKRCHCTSLLKKRLSPGQGMVIMINYDTQEIELPPLPIERWFIDNYARIYDRSVDDFYNPIQINVENKKIIVDYPLSEDEFIIQDSYIHSKQKFSLEIVIPEEHYQTYYETETSEDLTDNSDDVKAYLRNKNRNKQEAEEPIVFYQEEQKMESNDNEVADTIADEVADTIAEVADTIAYGEQIEEEEEEEEQQEDEKEPIRENSLAKELFEKHNQSPTSQTDTASTSYSSRLWSFFGWK
jgi:hypothetical protein